MHADLRAQLQYYDAIAYVQQATLVEGGLGSGLGGAARARFNAGCITSPTLRNIVLDLATREWHTPFTVSSTDYKTAVSEAVLPMVAALLQSSSKEQPTNDDENEEHATNNQGSLDLIHSRDDRVWRTALHIAAESGLLPLVNLLLSRGADPTLQDKLGKYFWA